MVGTEAVRLCGAVLAATVATVLAVLIGVIAAALIAGAVLVQSPVGASLLLAVFVGVVTVAATTWLAGSVVPRVAGRPYVPLGPRRSRTVVFLGALVAAAVFAAPELGDDLRVAATWFVGVAASGAVGAHLGAQRTTTRDMRT